MGHGGHLGNAPVGTVGLARAARPERQITKVWTDWTPRILMPINSLPLAPLVSVVGATFAVGDVWTRRHHDADHHRPPTYRDLSTTRRPLPGTS